MTIHKVVSKSDDSFAHVLVIRSVEVVQTKY